MRVVILVEAKADLLDVVGTADAIGRLAHLLDRREQQGNERADYYDHNE